MIRGDRRLHIDKAEVGVMKDVSHVGEECGPALNVGALGGCRSANRLMGNHVAGDGKADPGQFVGIRDDGPGGVDGATENGSSESGYKSQAENRSGQAGMALPSSEECGGVSAKGLGKGRLHDDWDQEYMDGSWPNIRASESTARESYRPSCARP
jgi:hypothetical protein